MYNNGGLLLTVLCSLNVHGTSLTIHVGVSGIAEHFTIETQAHRKGYQRMDYFDKCPPNHTCPAEGAIRLQTKLNVERICNEFNNCFETKEKMKAASSKDAGRYLCEYIYYTSLSVNKARTLFVHVPDTQIYSSTETARGLEKILDLCLEQVLEEETYKGLTAKLKNAGLGDTEENNEI